MEHEHLTWPRVLWLLRRAEEPGRWLLDLPLVCIENCEGCRENCGDLVEMLEAGELTEKVDFFELALVRSRRQAEWDWETLHKGSAEWLRQTLKRRPASYGMVNLLVEESRRLASIEKTQALLLAEAAVEMAHRLPTRLPDDDSLVEPFEDEPLDPPAKAEMLALAYAVHGNALRVAYRIWDAPRSYQKARDYLAETESEGHVFQGCARVLSLYASFLTDTRQLQEALAVLEEAQEAVEADQRCPADLRAAVVIKRARVLGFCQQEQQALSCLTSIPRTICAELPVDYRFGLLFMTALQYLYTGDIESAADFVPQIQELGDQLGRELDALKVRWLEALIVRERGDHDTSLERLQNLQKEFLERECLHEASLLTLDIAWALYAKGRHQETLEYAREAFSLFLPLNLPSESMMAMALLARAARRQALDRDLLIALMRLAQGGEAPDQPL